MKSIKVKIVLFVTAVLLAITAMGSLITAYATEKTEINSNGSVVYSETLSVEPSGVIHTYTVRMQANVDVASFDFAIQFPSIVKVVGVYATDDINNLNNANFTFNLTGDGNLVYVSFTSGENVMGNIDLVNVDLQVLETGRATPYFYDKLMFTNTRFEYFTSVGTALGSINAGGVVPMPTVNKGDVNLDGFVDLTDLVMMQRHIVNIRTEYLVGSSFINGDIDGNGLIETIDCQYVQMYLVGELESLNGIGGGSQYPGGEEGTQTLQVNVSFVLLASDGGITYLNQYITNVPVGSNAWDVVGSQVYVYDYQFNTLALDKYGKTTIDGGYIVSNGMELFVIYQGEKISTETYTVEVVICDQQGNTIHTEYVKIYRGAQIWEATSRTDVYMYGVQGVYHDAERTNPVNDNDPITGDMTIYVVSPDYKYVPKVKATVYVVTEEGEMLTSTTDENVREGSSVWSIVNSYCHYNGYRFKMMAKDPYGNEQVLGSAVVSDGLEVYAIMEKGETEWHSLRIYRMMVSGDKIIEMGWHGSDGTMANMPLASLGVGEESGYQKAGVYYDAELTIPVGEFDVLDRNLEVYVKFVAPEMSGTYDLYGVVMDDKYGPMPGNEIIGSVTFEGGILLLTTERGENVGGQYVDLGGMYQAIFGSQDCVMVMVQGTNAYLYYEFYGSDYQFEPSVQEVVGHYEFVADGDNYVVDLYDNAVFAMSMYGTTMFGYYTYDATTYEVSLNVMGDSARCIFDPATKTLTPIIEDDGPNYGDMEEPEQNVDVYGRTFYAPTEDAYGNQVQHELSCTEEGNWTLILEPSYAQKLGLQGNIFSPTEVYVIGSAVNFFIDQYKVFNITLHSEWNGFSIYKYVDLSNNQYNETCAEYVGTYQLYFKGEMTTVQLYDNGIAEVYYNGARDIAEFYEVEEGVLSIGDRDRVIVSGDMLIIEETDDNGGSSGTIDSTITGGMVGTITKN